MRDFFAVPLRSWATGSAPAAASGNTRHVLARFDSALDADLGVGRLGDLTMDQLAVNGEGQDRFVLHLAVRDASTGETVMRSAIFG